MAATRANTVGTAAYRGGALREDLIDKMFEQSRAETPFLSTLGKTTASLPRHEWQTYQLADPVENAQSGSYEFNTTNAADFTTRRLSNYTQVFGKTIHIEGSLLRSNPAGAKNWYAKTLEVRMKEIKRDMEKACLTYDIDTAANADQSVWDAGSGTDARRLAGVYGYANNWVFTQNGTVNYTNAAGTRNAPAAGNTSNLNNITAVGVISGTAAGTAASGNFAVDGGSTLQYTAAQTGNRSLSGNSGADGLAYLNEGFQLAFNTSGMLTAMQVPTRLKAAVSDVLIAGNGGAAQRRASEMAKKVNLAVDAVMTEFAYDISIIPNYIMDQYGLDANRTIVAYNPGSINVAVLQDYSVEVDGTARYGRGSVIFCDKTLEVEKPNDIVNYIGLSA